MRWLSDTGELCCLTTFIIHNFDLNKRYGNGLAFFWQK